MKKLLIVPALLVVLTGCVEESLSVEKTIEDGGAYSAEIKVDKEENKQGNNSEVNSDNVDSKEKLDAEEADQGNKKEQSFNNVKDDKESEILKVLSKHEVEIETVDFDEQLNLIVNKTHTLGGYVESKKAEEKGGKLSSNLNIKVPIDKYSEMKNFLSKNFHISSENIESIDVTEKFYDVESRIKALEERENRLLKMYDSAKDVESIIKIDDKLFEIIEEKEELQKQKMKIDDRMTFSKIAITIKEVNKLPKDKSEPGEISQAFSSSWNKIKETFLSIVIIFIKVMPAIVFSVVLAIPVAFYYFFKNKKYNK